MSRQVIHQEVKSLNAGILLQQASPYVCQIPKSGGLPDESWICPMGIVGPAPLLVESVPADGLA